MIGLLHRRISLPSMLLGFLLSWSLACGDKKGSQQQDGDEGAIERSDSKKPEKLAEVPEYVRSGRELYDKHCLICHQSDGSGVYGLNPPLKGTEYVTGDKDRLISILIKGSNVGLKVDGNTYANAMPGFSYLSDRQLADLGSYVRIAFGPVQDTIGEARVGLVREK